MGAGLRRVLLIVEPFSLSRAEFAVVIRSLEDRYECPDARGWGAVLSDLPAVRDLRWARGRQSGSDSQRRGGNGYLVGRTQPANRKSFEAAMVDERSAARAAGRLGIAVPPPWE